MKRQPKITHYTDNKPYQSYDYTELRLLDDIAFGLCEVEGIRYNEQEDAIVLSTKEVAVFPTLASPLIIQAFQNTFSLLQERFGQVDHMGTTCCSVTAWLDQSSKNIMTWVANLGDSAAFLIILDKNGKIKKAETLHPLHDSCEFSNSKRLSRGFGDLHRNSATFSRNPDILYQTYPYAEGDHAWIVLACDGLTECEKISEESIGHLIQTHQHDSVELIAEALVNAAYDQGQGSTDNISVGVFKITRKPASMTVFDGHGGTYRGKESHLKAMRAVTLVKNISSHFYTLLEEQINLALGGPPRL